MGFNLLIRENKAFFTLHTLLLLLGSYPLLAFEKVSLFLQLNSLHHPFLDQFFYYITFLGSSTMYALLMATLVVTKLDNRTLLTGISSFTAMSAIVQGMKRIIFLDQLRPIALIPTEVPLHLVAGIVPDTHLTFPSGHAATIFTAVCFMHLLVPQKSVWFSGLLLFGATVVAYSRVYLCQHFYQDIYVGAWVGTWTTTLVYGVLTKWQGPAWLDQQLPALLFAKVKRRTPGPPGS
jgi:membrane-associated phospholipid phosphatase